MLDQLRMLQFEPNAILRVLVLFVVNSLRPPVLLPNLPSGPAADHSVFQLNQDIDRSRLLADNERVQVYLGDHRQVEAQLS